MEISIRQGRRINYDYKPKKSGQLWEKLRTEFTDKYAPLERLEKGCGVERYRAQKKVFTSKQGLSAGIPERANRIIESELKPIIKGIEAKGHSYKDLGLYAEAVHAKDVNAAGMVSGFFSDSEIDDIITKVRAIPLWKMPAKSLSSTAISGFNSLLTMM